MRKKVIRYVNGFVWIGVGVFALYFYARYFGELAIYIQETTGSDISEYLGAIIYLLGYGIICSLTMIQVQRYAVDEGAEGAHRLGSSGDSESTVP